jgi:hypothetical protein
MFGWSLHQQRMEAPVRVIETSGTSAGGGFE